MQRYTQRGLDFGYRARLKINETFKSIQGEGLHSGLPCTFIRLTGCALRCSYCDTEHAFYGGSWRSFQDLYAYVEEMGTPYVQITGGEPLHQKAVWPFVDGLVERGFVPLIETSGAVSIQGLHPRAHIVLDIKTPESGEAERMYWPNLAWLKPSDEIKFVVCSEADFDWSLETLRQHQLDRRFQVLISPAAGLAGKALLAEKLIESGVQARFQLQLHKLLWGDEQGR